MVTGGPFSTTPGNGSPAPYLTGAFAGKGGFTVSPILGYQAGGLNLDGTPNTTSRQFQAGLSVTGQGAAQNATLFVMTSAIGNAPHIGFTQAGGFTGVTVRNNNPTGPAWYGLAGGAVSSATPTSAPNTVPTVNGTPIASFTLNNTLTNLQTGAVSNSQSSNFVQTASSNYTFNPVTTATPRTFANNHPTLFLNGYVGGVMVTATGGPAGGIPASLSTPYVVTNFSGKPGDVGIFLPGNSSEMLAVFDVGSVNAPVNAMTRSGYVFGSVVADTQPVLNGARGAYVNPSNFAARAATIFDNGANVPISSRTNQPNPTNPSLLEPVGFADQQLVTADSVGANTPVFLTSISTAAGGVTPCACDSTKWGFWSAFNGQTDGNTRTFEDQGPLLLWVAGVPVQDVTGINMARGTATYTGQAIANIANPNNITSYLAAGAFSNTVNFLNRNGAVTITGLDGTNYTGMVNFNFAQTNPPPGTVPTFATTTPLVGSNGGRTATLAGSFFQGAATSAIPGFGEMGGSLILKGTAANPYLGSGIFAARSIGGIQPIK